MKKQIFSTLVLSIGLLLPFSLHSQEQRKKVGVVLSGGGAKGMAHIKALKVIEEAGIPIDYIAGTSMGAIVGGLYAIGYTPEQLDSMVRKQDWTFLLSDRIKRSAMSLTDRERSEKYTVSIPFTKTPKDAATGGIMKGQNLANLFSDLTVGYHDSIDFNKLPIPFACVAANVVNGEQIVFHDGILSTAMRASMAIPGVFTPVRQDSMVLVDGGIVNNYPADVVNLSRTSSAMPYILSKLSRNRYSNLFFVTRLRMNVRTFFSSRLWRPIISTGLFPSGTSSSAASADTSSSSL